MNAVDIMRFIGVGRENAVTRSELVSLLNLPDRKIRNLIEDARKRGEIIINDSSGVGYYTTDDIGDMKRQLKTNHNRAMSILVQQKFLRRRIKEKEAELNAEADDGRAEETEV